MLVMVVPGIRRNWGGGGVGGGGGRWRHKHWLDMNHQPSDKEVRVRSTTHICRGSSQNG